MFGSIIKILKNPVSWLLEQTTKCFINYAVVTSFFPLRSLMSVLFSTASCTFLEHFSITAVNLRKQFVIITNSHLEQTTFKLLSNMSDLIKYLPPLPLQFTGLHDSMFP